MYTATDLADRSVADLSTQIPGATAVFRSHKIDFCCGGGARLADAAAARGIALEQLTHELAALIPSAAPAAESVGALLDRILERYHAVHRRELPELIRLARRVEAVHGDKPSAPRGLAAFLERMEAALEAHMQREEQVLFPLMRSGGHPMIRMPITAMREEHDEHGASLRELARLTGDHTPPPEACNTWRALFAGTRKLADDLMEHIALENNDLFRRFGA